MADGKPLLTLCMIVRNEARMLPGCLESVAHVVDEIVIADTGSEDATLEIAARFGARIVHHEWKDDFAEARNASIAAATGRWILWLDADERLRPAEHDLLRDLIRSGCADAFTVPIYSETHTGTQVTKGHRLFRNGPGVQFSGRIHEQVSPSFGRLRYRVSDAPFSIDHLGYNLEEARMKLKSERNLRLLRQAREQRRRDPYVRYTLAQALMLTQDLPTAENELRAALGEVPTEPMESHLPSDIRAAAHSNLAQCALERNDPNEALQRCAKSLAEVKGQLTAHLMRYRAYKALDQHEPALRALEQVERMLAQSPRSYGAAVETAVDKADLYRGMGHACLKLDRVADARRHFEMALKTGGQTAGTLAALSRCAVADGALDEALRLASEAAQLAPNDDSLLDLAAFILIRCEKFNEAAECMGNLLLRRPGDVALRRRLAGVLVKAGRSEDAKLLLMEPVSHASDSPAGLICDVRGQPI